MIDAAFGQLQPLLTTKTACDLLGKSRAMHYRRRRPVVSRPRPARPAPANALTPLEQAQVLAVLRHDDFVDKAPAQVWATLLDEGQYPCSQSTMYRILRQHGEVRERRAQATHPAKVKPELVATAPAQVYSWDITKLQGPGRGEYFHLYVMLDIFSRYVVGWTVAAGESADLAKAFITDITTTHGAPHAIHADRGTSMTSKPVAQLLLDLGVARSHSRPRVSNDNPYPQAQFKTLKYCPAFPLRHRRRNPRRRCREPRVHLPLDGARTLAATVVPQPRRTPAHLDQPARQGPRRQAATNRRDCAPLGPVVGAQTGYQRAPGSSLRRATPRGMA